VYYTSVLTRVLHVCPVLHFQVVGKFDREKKGVVDFLDFLTYIPLFLEVHTRIVSNPFGPDDDL